MKRAGFSLGFSEKKDQIWVDFTERQHSNGHTAPKTHFGNVKQAGNKSHETHVGKNES